MCSTRDIIGIFACLAFTSVVIPQASACPMGYYGAMCRQVCSSHCSSMTCHNVTGACDGDCEDGWVGPTCDTPCTNGTYGYNCSKTCPEQCEGLQCHATNGSCTEGCKTGYVGDKCQMACLRGFFGRRCQHRCPNNCVDAKCHHESGYCISGCKDGFWGSDCSLSGNIKDASEETKSKFYISLSAESKSILLYMLMGEYENTLGRAQEEIRRGIRQRNEIRRLIG